MKNLIFISALLLLSVLSLSAFAQQSTEDIRKSVFEKLPSCENAIFSDDAYFASSLKKTAPHSGIVRVTSLSGANEYFDVYADDNVVDIKIQDGILYVLTETSLDAWNIATKTKLYSYKSHPNTSVGDHWRHKASGFILRGTTAIISHSVYGVSVLDLSNGAFKKTLSMPTVSSAQDISYLDANTAVLAIDNDDEAAFRGLYLMDLNSLEFTKQIKVDSAFSSSVRVLPGNRLMLGFFNAIWKFDLNDVLRSSGEPKPLRRSWKFPRLFMVDLQGKVFYGEKYFYGCFKTMDENTNARKIEPLVFTMDELVLN